MQIPLYESPGFPLENGHENICVSVLYLYRLAAGNIVLSTVELSEDSVLYVACSRSLPTVEISELSVTQSVECPLTLKDTAVVGGQLSTRNGTGAGSVSLALRRILSHTAWAEVIRLIISHFYFYKLLFSGHSEVCK